MVDQSPKVVDLQSRREPTTTDATLSAPLAAIRDKCVLFLNDRLCNLLDDVDDALFELADEASNAREQHLYFDAMREIRVNRQAIEVGFAESFVQGFHFLGSTSRKANSLESGKAKLRLLESEALEELVALEGMAKKAERRFLQEIWVLCTAWQQGSNGPVVAAKELPMGPAKIAAALGIACQCLDVDIKARLVLFKLFDTQIITAFGDLYSVLVPVLEAQGLPVELLATKPQAAAKDELGKAADAAPTERSNAKPTAESSQSAELVTQLFDAFDSMLGGSKEPGANSAKAAVSKPSFMVALQDMQNEQFAQFNVQISMNGEAGVDFTAIAQKLIARLSQVIRVASTDASALSYQRDQDTINFVGALFQYILEGDGLAEPLKGLIARLQIPVLKMAMLDKGFFAHEEHPARKLLSALVSAGIGWSPVAGVDKDPLYREIEKVVMRVLRDFGVDTQVFVDAHEEFLTFNEKAKRRAELVARRTVDTEDGRAVAEAARMYIAGVLEIRLAGVDCPPVLTKILQLGWSKVLFLSYIQHGKDSERFAEDTGLINRLLWSVLPSNEAGHRNELIATLPLLVETLRLGFNRVSLNNFETAQWFEQLERLHLAKLSRKEIAPPVEPAPVVPSESDIAALDAALAESLDGGSDDSERTATNEQATADSVANTINNDEESAARLQSLRVGNWVDFRQSDGKMLRCRLAAVINGIGRYIFVNRSGIKVAEFNRDELELALRQKSVLLIEDDRLFDRALESVISNLRDMKDKPL
ncbi:MAG: DUF1631 domain-containing protein [Zhongshania sp.]|uniref:DUF1631 domain-containing protein n=1 Tax=Zhongshania sp. TaxID=1971902 RepID=UPI002608C722|nr:DUF1631 domain-containing protein [Zhongshania sp.]MDF1692974.1 DUF1631 domain-containing protein [Zhongshania sp.]